MLVDITRGWDYLSEQREEIIRSYTCEITHFPLCCSTGVLNNLTARDLQDSDAATWKELKPTAGDLYDPRDKNLLQMLRETAGRVHYLFPREAAAWLAIAAMWKKFTTGQDDGGDCGYTGYKVAHFLLADRINEDKRNGARFNSYNMTFSCDDLMDYLEGLDLGEVLVSTPRVGAHEARCRAAIFTPDMDALKTFIDEKTQLVRKHILETNEYLDKYTDHSKKEKTIW